MKQDVTVAVTKRTWKICDKYDLVVKNFPVDGKGGSRPYIFL